MSGYSISFLRALKQIKSLIFPPLCFHCQGGIEDHRHLLCSSCFDLITLIDPKERCPICFARIHVHNKRCHSCPSQVLKYAAACENQGPIASLLNQLKYHKRFAIAGGLAPWLTMQWAALKWPLPDLIIPMPQTLSHRLQRGYSSAELLAQEVSKHLQVPKQSFHFKNKRFLVDKTILLLADEMVTGASLRSAAERLKECAPRQIYGLALTYRDYSLTSP